MKIKYSYMEYKDCLAASEISKSRAKRKIYLCQLYGWMVVLSTTVICAMLFSKKMMSFRYEGIGISLIIAVVSGVQLWRMVRYYDKITEKKIEAAVTRYIAGNRKFIESDTKIDSLNISAEVIVKQCMGCGNIGRTQRCVASKKGYKIGLPLCERCICKLKSKAERVV